MHGKAGGCGKLLCFRLTESGPEHERIRTAGDLSKAHWLWAGARQVGRRPGRKARRLSKAPIRTGRCVSSCRWRPAVGWIAVARVIGEQISREFAQNMFIENRTGAGGTLGIDMAIESPPDGYTVLITNDNVACRTARVAAQRGFSQGVDLRTCLLGPPASGLRRASVVDRRQFDRRFDRTGEAEAWHRLCDLGCWLEPACADGVVLQASGHQARSCALSRRRPGDQ